MSLQLGAVTFRDLEIPDTVPIGGAHAHKLHKLQGGVRVLDAMGRDDEPKSWAGRMLGPDAASRVQQLDAYRIAGQAIALSWDQYNFTVFVSQFRAEQLQSFHFTYSITVEVLVDNSQPQNDGSGSDVDDQTAADMMTATSLSGQIGDSTLATNMTTLQSAVAAVPSFLSATKAQIASVLSPISVAQGQVANLIANTDAGLSSFAGLTAGLPAAQLADDLTSAAAGMVNSANLYSLKAVLGRMGKNLANVQLAGSQIIADGHTDLFGYASRFYGDPSEWATIAAANGLADPEVAAGTTLLIPTASGNTGGVLQ